MNPLKRVNYFSGQLLSATDFQDEQEYHREKLRRQNRALHGRGVVEGLQVSAAKNGASSTITVTPGSALDSTGELLQLCEATKLEVNSLATAALVCLRFSELLSDQSPVTGPRLAESSQPSRIEEGCELVLMDEAPVGASKTRSLATSNLTSAILARLVRARTGWKVDRKFKVARAR